MNLICDDRWCHWSWKPNPNQSSLLNVLKPFSDLCHWVTLGRASQYHQFTLIIIVLLFIWVNHNTVYLYSILLYIRSTLEFNPVQSSIVSTPLVRLHLGYESSDCFSVWACGGCPVSIQILSQRWIKHMWIILRIINFCAPCVMGVPIIILVV